MTLSTVVTGNVQKQWDDKFYREYIRSNRFARYQGTDGNSIIQLKEQLTKKPGDAITLSLIKALSGAGVTGNTLLEGAEEAVSNYAHQITIGAYRNGVAMTEWEEQKSPIVALDNVRPLLKDWAMELNRTKIIAALSAVIPDSGVQEPYATASVAERDEFVVSNTDRLLFGALVANHVSGVFATALATLDSTADKFTKAKVSLMKRIAKKADPIIRPVRVNDDEEWYVAFCGSECFRDLKEDLASTHASAMQRGKDNPLFTDGDLVYDGVIIREVPEIAALATNVGEVFLCGAQAVGHVVGKRWSSATEQRDFGFVSAAAIAGFFGTEKLVFNGKQHGVVTGYMYAALDA